MKKIVLFTDRPEKLKGLITHLKILFPECEIHILSKQDK